MKKFLHKDLFGLESGASFQGIEVAYHTVGQLLPDHSNVVWVCHALTANSDVLDWWEGLFGEGKQYDPNKHFIICANVLGSPYGSTNPSSINPKTERSFYSDFPLVTIRDIVKSLELLRVHLGIKKIGTLIGGSMGGFQ
jgi:homoserine O-acetyltransferase